MSNCVIMVSAHMSAHPHCFPVCTGSMILVGESRHFLHFLWYLWPVISFDGNLTPAAPEMMLVLTIAIWSALIVFA